MDREDLLLAVSRAASAYAIGSDDLAAQRALDGRQFELRIRFGCNQGAGEDKALNWRLDEQKGIVRVRAAPTISMEDQVVRTIGTPDIEAVEGFWIGRPWLLTASCPAAKTPLAAAQQDEQRDGAAQKPPSDTAAAPPAPRVGIAQFFTDEDPRTRRRQQRPYEASDTLSEGEAPSEQGYDLVLSGRLKRLADNRVIACTSEDTTAPPRCIISANFGRVWIERPGARKILAQWDAG